MAATHEQLLYEFHQNILVKVLKTFLRKTPCALSAAYSWVNHDSEPVKPCFTSV